MKTIIEWGLAWGKYFVSPTSPPNNQSFTKKWWDRKLLLPADNKEAPQVTFHLLAHLCETVITRLEKGKGRKSQAVEEALGWWRSLQEKIATQEDAAKALLEYVDTISPSAAAAPALKRRRRHKSGTPEEAQSPRQLPSAGECPFAGLPQHHLKIEYEYKMPEFRTRRYAVQRHAAQNLSQVLQTSIFR
eukprot:s3213_g3.t1